MELVGGGKVAEERGSDNSQRKGAGPETKEESTQPGYQRK